MIDMKLLLNTEVSFLYLFEYDKIAKQPLIKDVFTDEVKV
jgi:hypothetical protein